MKLRLQETIDLLQNEINWCLDHPDNQLNKDQQYGFMNGLRQAQILIRNAENELITVQDYRKNYDNEKTTLAYTKFVNGTIDSNEFNKSKSRDIRERQ